MKNRSEVLMEPPVLFFAKFNGGERERRGESGEPGLESRSWPSMRLAPDKERDVHCAAYILSSKLVAQSQFSPRLRLARFFVLVGIDLVLLALTRDLARIAVVTHAFHIRALLFPASASSGTSARSSSFSATVCGTCACSSSSSPLGELQSLHSRTPQKSAAATQSAPTPGPRDAQSAAQSAE